MINEKSMTLLTDWRGQNVDGWFWSEKLRGCRGYWQAVQKTFWTRGGKAINIPKFWRAQMPDFDLDCEIYAGRCNVETVARVAVQFGKFTAAVVPVVIDVPQARGTWLERMAAGRKELAGNKLIQFAKGGIIRCYAEMNHIACNIIYTGGEGIVMRNPAVDFYEIGRTENALRLKA